MSMKSKPRHAAAFLSSGTARALSQGETEVDPRTAAAQFRHAFAAKYGAVHPDWVESGWQVGSGCWQPCGTNCAMWQVAVIAPDVTTVTWACKGGLGHLQDATAAAARQYKFLLVYLHAAGHDDTPRFCRETLTAPEVRHGRTSPIC